MQSAPAESDNFYVFRVARRRAGPFATKRGISIRRQGAFRNQRRFFPLSTVLCTVLPIYIPSKIARRYRYPHANPRIASPVVEQKKIPSIRRIRAAVRRCKLRRIGRISSWISREGKPGNEVLACSVLQTEFLKRIRDPPFAECWLDSQRNARRSSCAPLHSTVSSPKPALPELDELPRLKFSALKFSKMRHPSTRSEFREGPGTYAGAIAPSSSRRENILNGEGEVGTERETRRAFPRR